MIVLFAVIVGVTGWGFVRQPTGFLPTEDQGYAVLVSILPEGASQPRSRAVADKIDAHPREDRRARGLGDHRRVLRPRLRQRPQRLHDLRRVQGLERARQGAEPGPDRLRPQPRALRDPGSAGLRGDSAAHPRPGPDRRLPDDGGGPPQPRPERARSATPPSSSRRATPVRACVASPPPSAPAAPSST